MPSKSCTRCHTAKQLDQFYRKDSARDGRRSECKDCIKAMNRRWEDENRDRRREINQAFRDANPEYFHLYYVENREAHQAACRRWEADNFDHRRQTQRAYREANREHLLQKRREWRANNRQQARLEVHERRAKLRGIFVERVDLEVLWLRDEGICGICGFAADPEHWDLDHIIPVSHHACDCGNHPPPTHSYANARVSHPSCNRWKSARLDADLPPIPPHIIAKVAPMELQDAI